MESRNENKENSIWFKDRGIILMSGAVITTGQHPAIN
jgi:hypothetical protein